jgi:hypothetical protein
VAVSGAGLGANGEVVVEEEPPSSAVLEADPNGEGVVDANALNALPVFAGAPKAPPEGGFASEEAVFPRADPKVDEAAEANAPNPPVVGAEGFSGWAALASDVGAFANAPKPPLTGPAPKLGLPKAGCGGC